MEISAADNVAFRRSDGCLWRTHLLRLYEHQRIVHRRVHLDLECLATMRERIAYRAVYLRNTAQRIRVLNAPAVLVRLADRILAFQHAPHIRRNLHLPLMWAGLVNALVE